MKVSAFFHGVLQNDKIVLKVNDEKDLYNIQKMFRSKKDRENRSQKEILLKCEIDAEFQHRSFKQKSAVFKLVEIIFESEEGRPPLTEEKYNLYLDLLELYADKVPNRYGNQLRSIHISEANTIAGSHLIEGLLYHLTTLCHLNMDQESSVRSVIYDWEISRGKIENDINDERSIEDLKKYVKFSEASGRPYPEWHHIITRGACPAATYKAWNLVALTHDEHMFFHEKGWDAFLDRYPHLKGKFDKAKNKCADLIQQKNSIGIEI